MFETPHKEKHKSHRVAWLRAAVLGVDDGIVSTSSLMLGVLAASDSSHAVLTAGVAGLVAGALSMAAGEYVSVSSQKDSELYDRVLEERSLSENPEEELHELSTLYEKRGLEKELARTVATQLQAHDPVRTHLREELGITHERIARPLQAAVASAVSFSVGSLFPLAAAIFVGARGGWVICGVSLIALFAAGALGATIGGGGKLRAALRVCAGGGLAMAVTFGIGHFLGTAL